MISKFRRKKVGFDESKITNEVRWEDLAKLIGWMNKENSYGIRLQPFIKPSQSGGTIYDAKKHEDWIAKDSIGAGLLENIEFTRVDFRNPRQRKLKEFEEKNKLIIKNLKITSYSPVAWMAIELALDTFTEFRNCLFQDKTGQGVQLYVHKVISPGDIGLGLRECQIEMHRFLILIFGSSVGRDDYWGTGPTIHLQANRFLSVQAKSELSVVINRSLPGLPTPPPQIRHQPSESTFDPKKYVLARFFEERVNEENRDACGKLNLKDFYSEDFAEKEDSNRITLADIMRFLRLKHDLYKVDPSDVAFQDISGELVLRDNAFDNLSVGGGGLIKIENGNEANEVSIGGKKVYLSPHNNLTKDASMASEHRATFLALQEQAAKRNDLLQEQIMKREVIRCERQLLRGQMSLGALQDKLILWWGEFSSRHGVSWARPLGLLIALNFVLAIPFSVLCGTLDDSLLVFFELFKPLYYPACESSGALLLITCQKIAFAGLVYEVIRAGRRFARY